MPQNGQGVDTRRDTLGICRIDMRIEIIVGSHRKNSQSERVSEFLKPILQARGVEVGVYSLAGNPLPLWDEGVWAGDENWEAAWSPIASRLRSADGFIVISPEWGGMVPPGLKNFLLLCSPRDVGHKPALLVAVSSGTGGAYPISELRASSYKNNRLAYLPDHVIIREVEQLFNGDADLSASEIALRERIEYSTSLLVEYAKALRGVRSSGVVDFKRFPFGQ